MARDQKERGAHNLVLFGLGCKFVKCLLFLVEFGGQLLNLVQHVLNETLPGGSYNVSIFVDGNMIGSRNFTFEK